MVTGTLCFASVHTPVRECTREGMTRRNRPGSAAVAIAYIRVSTDRQELGPEAQRTSIEQWARASGVTVANWSTDTVSGASELSDRPGLAAALAALREHGAGVLVVARRDRLARDVAVAAAITRATEQCGARVVSADGTANGEGAADSFLRTILDAAAAYERELIRSRTKAALRAKKEKGERVGCVPFGFAVDTAGKLVPLESEQRTLHLVEELRARGLTLRAIVAELEAQGIRSRSGRPLALTQVARIVSGLCERSGNASNQCSVIACPETQSLTNVKP